MIKDVNEFAKDSLSTCQIGEKTHKIEGTLYFKIKPSILGCSHSFIFFCSDGPIKLAHCKKRKIELGRHLILLIGEINNLSVSTQ
jgi:hypothetical protein